MNLKNLINIVTFIIPINVYAIDYSDAINHAKDAFLIQSGINDDIRKLGDYGKLRLEQLGLAKEFAVGYFGYRVYKTKTIGLPLGHGKRLNITTNSANIIIPF